MIELVWDQRQQGTATTALGTTVTVGGTANFSPDELLATAVAGCVMRTFLRLTADAGAPILSYVANAFVEPGDLSDPLPRVHVGAYIVAPPGSEAAEILVLFDRAVAESPIAGLLRDRAVLTPNLRVFCDAGAGCA